jgi:putative phosphoesterase
MKIGIIGDTHIPALSPVLPARIREVFQGLDIILHVGDICELYVLQEFQEAFTLTFAVSGEEDSEAVKRYLDEKRVVRFGERRVGMIHGHQVEELYKKPTSGLRWFLGRKPEPATWLSLMLGQFAEEEVDAIVFGHTHKPYAKMHGGVLLFNPGSALPGPDRHPSVGILDIGKRSITGKIVYL